MKNSSFFKNAKKFLKPKKLHKSKILSTNDNIYEVGTSKFVINVIQDSKSSLKIIAKNLENPLNEYEGDFIIKNIFYGTRTLSNLKESLLKKPNTVKILMKEDELHIYVNSNIIRLFQKGCLSKSIQQDSIKIENEFEENHEINNSEKQIATLESLRILNILKHKLDQISNKENPYQDLIETISVRVNECLEKYNQISYIINKLSKNKLQRKSHYNPWKQNFEEIQLEPFRMSDAKENIDSNRSRSSAFQLNYKQVNKEDFEILLNQIKEILFKNITRVEINVKEIINGEVNQLKKSLDTLKLHFQSLDQEEKILMKSSLNNNINEYTQCCSKLLLSSNRRNKFHPNFSDDFISYDEINARKSSSLFKVNKEAQYNKRNISIKDFIRSSNNKSVSNLK